MNARINREYDRFDGRFKYILRCSNVVLNGTMMGHDLHESKRSLQTINKRRQELNLDAIDVYENVT